MVSDLFDIAAGLFVIVSIPVAIVVYAFLLLGSSQRVRDCVVKAERVNYQNSSEYLIFGKNEVYEDTDSFLRWKFNSSDFYRDIEAGKCYEFQVQGWRVPFLSWYRNIYAFKKVK